MSQSQQDRVLAALRRAGRFGITQVDFSLPDVVDGGKPITRVAARIKDLRDVGHIIAKRGTRSRCAVYILKRQVVSDEPVRDQPRLGGPDRTVGEPPSAGSSDTTTLFDPAVGAPVLGAYDELDEAA